MLSLNHGSLPINVVANVDVAVRRAACTIVRIINMNNSVSQPTKIVFATGATMIPLYAELVREYNRGHVSFQNVIGANLDEYDIEPSHPESYHTYMWDNLYRYVDINPNNIYLPTCYLPADSQSTSRENKSELCNKYASTLDTLGPFDIQLLGIGRNGHIGFNEPPCRKDSSVHIVKLAASTCAVNTAPSQYAITMGIADIMKAQRIILIATGEAKADTIVQLIDSQPNNEDMPASFIKSHPNAMMICDWDAACKVDIMREKVNEIVKNGALNNYLSVFGENASTITIMSPHPDDDVIGVGGAMSHLSATHDISVVYQTTGRNAVNKDALLHHKMFLESLGKGRITVSDSLIATNIRRTEATIAAKICGVDDVEFLEMPFYKRKVDDSNAPHVELDDVEYMRDVIKRRNPDILLINGDTDPNHTHNHCRTAVIKALDDNPSPPTVFEYCSAWGEFSLTKVSVIIPLTEQQLQIKERAVLAHVSQNPPIAHNGNATPFHERAVSNPRDALALLIKMGFEYPSHIAGVELLSSLRGASGSTPLRAPRG